MTIDRGALDPPAKLGLTPNREAAPVLTVVIPCRDHGHYLREALDSIGTPAHPAEAVVVDAGSTDDTSRVAEAAAATSPIPITYVRQEEEGLANARNRGFNGARGRYVVFLDADDRLAPGALDIGARALDEHPECFFVFGRGRMMSADGTPLPTPAQPRVARDHYRELLRRNYIWMPAMVMFRREAVELAGGFDTRVNASADYALYLHIARHHPVHHHGQLVAHHRRHGSNMRGDAARMLRETLAVLRAQRPFLEGDEASLAAYREGWQMWQKFYGTRLVNEIRTHVAENEWWPAALKSVALARYDPRGLAYRISQKARLTLGHRGKSLATGR